MLTQLLAIIIVFLLAFFGYVAVIVTIWLIWKVADKIIDLIEYHLPF